MSFIIIKIGFETRDNISMKNKAQVVLSEHRLLSVFKKVEHMRLPMQCQYNKYNNTSSYMILNIAMLTQPDLEGHEHLL